jgi:uncharacterized protein YdbL (DUF1318 family)
MKRLVALLLGLAAAGVAFAQAPGSAEALRATGLVGEQYDGYLGAVAPR